MYVSEMKLQLRLYIKGPVLQCVIFQAAVPTILIDKLKSEGCLAVRESGSTHAEVPD